MSAVKKRPSRRVKTAAKKGVLRPRTQATTAANDPSAWPLYQLLPEGVSPYQDDPEVIPYRVDGAVDGALREFGVWQQWFARMSSDPTQRSAPFWGVISPNFHLKTGLNTRLIREAVATKPGFDLYLISPTPELEAVFGNLWLQGATVHPELLGVARKLLAAAQLPDHLAELQPSNVFCTGLHAIATPKVWMAYGQFLTSVIESARQKLSKRQQRLLERTVPDPLSLFHGATYWSVILERLMPMFFKTAGASFKRARLPIPLAEQRLNGHLRKLREMKDVAHQTRSKWLATCWVHYRNAYLQGVLSPEWCATHLPSLTPKDIEFY